MSEFLGVLIEFETAVLVEYTSSERRRVLLGRMRVSRNPSA